MSPRDLAEQIVQYLPPSPLIERTEIAGPGFINFFFASEAWVRLVQEIQATGDSYGSSKIGTGERVLVEFVSSNPTGPLHVGHGRGAAYGDALGSSSPRLRVTTPRASITLMMPDGRWTSWR